jgi:HAD superfamily hydrolase (TIGR01662 family)
LPYLDERWQHLRMGSAVRAAFFDFGNTLVEARGDEDQWQPLVLSRVAEAFGSQPWAELLYAADLRRPPFDDPHRQDTIRWIAAWFRDRGESWTEEEVIRLRDALASPLPDAFSLAPGAEAALRWCKEQGLPVAILTNTITRGDAEVWEDCRRLGLGSLVDHVVSSYSTGWSKPHPAMFERALKRFGVERGAAFMVGDQLGEDIVGAKRAGLRAIWKSTTPLPEGSTDRPDVVIGSLVELPTVAGSWLSV